MASGDKHPNEGALMKFLERGDQTADYVRRTADWVKDRYPGSAPTLLPRMRRLYKNKRQSEGQ